MTTATSATNDDEPGEFIPGSVTDTCGICFRRFDLQRPADQYKTVHNENADAWYLICDDCGETPADGPAGFDMAYIAARLPWVADDNYLPEF